MVHSDEGTTYFFPYIKENESDDDVICPKDAGFIQIDNSDEYILDDQHYLGMGGGLMYTIKPCRLEGCKGSW